MFKVVVIDDENVVRSGIVLETDWEALDCEVVAEASDGTEGLEVIEKYRPDVVISDIRMPNMDGLTMLKTLRERGDDTYVIFLTAYSDFEYAQRAINYGAVNYLLKPFEDEDLADAIGKVKDKLLKINHIGNTRHEEDVLSHALLGKGDKSKYVADALDYISEHLADPDISIRNIAEKLEISESHLSHIFKKETDYTVNAYITRYRMRTAMKLLKNHKSKIYEVAEMVGYRDIAYFSSTFKKVTGVNPSEYQDRN